MPNNFAQLILPPRDQTEARAIVRLGRVLPHAQFSCLDAVRLTINFHPDRLSRSGRTVMEGLRDDGAYRNQFEVGTTNGDPSAFPGGLRHYRESEMFGGYFDDAPAADRPKYGSMDLLHGPFGGWPRFGSSYLVLRPAVLDRSTFLVGSGLSSRSWVGTRAALEKLLVAASQSPASKPRRSWRSDGWIELQVHGAVRLEQDVSKLVIDDSFQDTATGDVARRTAELYEIGLEWVPGLRSDLRKWRIPATRKLARSLVSQQVFHNCACTASEIGRVLYTDFEITRKILSMDSATRDDLAKYFWNRMLLCEDVSARLAGHPINSLEKRTD